MMHTSSRIVTIPWIDVDQVDTYIDASELVLLLTIPEETDTATNLP